MTTTTSGDQSRLAMLIDADNTSPKQVREMLEELARYGALTVRRAYGDWTTQQLAGWKDHLLAHAISPIQQFAYTTGKNATDSALIIDAMDLLYSGNVEGFVIVSSDSDFTRLATRLKESGMKVYGVGQRKTPKPFVEACDQFTYLENLTHEAAVDPTPAADGALESLVTKALNQTARDDGWSPLGEIGSYLIKSQPSFDSRSFGFGKLSDLVSSLGYVEVKWSGDAPGRGQLWARPKARRKATGETGRGAGRASKAPGTKAAGARTAKKASARTD
ncbi:NYN domain-containing protein [Nocardioides terrisoli]|uniref:NYN domain-containing protein n=1 Tax=Nocardioides terrisoli TaxID=3388267 RepID=UPI00287B68A1|nr:NYN domain-containing protein [Nocardioides marmorisolisilvae]